MLFGRIRTKPVAFHKSPEPLVAPRFAVFGEPLSQLEPIYSEKIPITRSNVSNRQDHATSNHKFEPLTQLESIYSAKILITRLNVSNRQNHATRNHKLEPLTQWKPIYSEKIPITRCNLSNRQNHATSNRKLEPLTQTEPIYSEKIPITRSNLSNRQNHATSNRKLEPLTQTEPIYSEKIPITRSNLSNRQNHATSNHKLEPLPRSLEKSPIPTHMMKVSLNPKYRTPSRNGTNIIHKKRRPPSVIGTKDGKRVSFAKTNDSSSTLTPEIGGRIEKIRFIPNNAPRTIHTSTNSQKHSKVPIRRYVRLVCLLSNTNNRLLPLDDSIRLLQLGIDPTNMFTDPKKCINFLKEKTGEALFLIISNELGQSIIHDIHPLPQINTIYVLGETKRKSKRWIKTWVKIKGIYPTIQSICEILKHDIQQYRRDSMAISISTVELEYLDASFMYTRLLTEILLEMGYDDRATQVFAQFCRGSPDPDTGKPHNPEVIDEFEKGYDPHKSINWYTRGCFLYKRINEALRKQDIEIIIKSGFFIRDLQKQIEALYKPPTEKIIVYRGQGLSEMDFEQLCLRQGGLYSFNTFLSTSTHRDVAYSFADSCRAKPELIGILFQIEIDLNIFTPTQWASIGTKSYYRREEEILFAMHSVFRIGEIKRIENSDGEIKTIENPNGEINTIENRFWQVQLSLTSDKDAELKTMTEFIREVTKGSSGWDRLGKFLLKIGKFSKAEEIFQMLIENTAEDDACSLGHRYHMLGLIEEQSKGDYKNALIFYNKALNIYSQYPDSNYLDLIKIYNNIGEMYRHTESYSEALENFRMALDIQKKFRMALDIQKNKCHAFNVELAVKYSNMAETSSYMAETYSNMAETYKCLKQYSEALQFYQRVLDIQKKAVPLNVTNLGVTYANIAKIYYITEEYSKALVLFRKVSRIQQYNHSSNNIDAAITDTHIGQVHEKLTEYPIALAYYEKALGILSQFKSSKIAELTNTYDNIARVYQNMNDNTKALQFYKKVLYNLGKHPLLTQPNSGIIYYSMGQIYENIQKTDKAILSYRHAIQFEQSEMFPDNFNLQLYQKHLAAARKKNNIAST